MLLPVPRSPSALPLLASLPSVPGHSPLPVPLPRVTALLGGLLAVPVPQGALMSPVVLELLSASAWLMVPA